MRKILVSSAALIVSHAIMGAGANPARAAGFENLDRIDSLVAATVGANIGEPGGAVAPVDRRLHLAACPQLPSIDGPVFGSAIVRCEQLGWRIRVPLRSAPALAANSPNSYVPAPQKPAALIKKGSPVILVAGNEYFSVSKQMIADEDGAIGDVIRVREDRNSPPVTGRVESDGIIRVPGI